MGVALQGSTAGSRLVGLEGGSTCRYSIDGLQTVAFSGNLTASGTSVFWGDVNGLIQGATYGGVAFSLTSSQSHGGGTNNGILLFDGGVGLEIAGGGNNLGGGRLYAFASPLTAPSLWAGSTGYSSNPLSGPIATSNGVIAALRSATTTVDLLRVDYAGGSKQALASTGLAFTGAQVPTPVAGRGGLLYVVDEAGNLAVASQAFADGASATRWSVGLPAVIAGATSASPTLTCNSRKPSASTGVLAFATETGWLVTYLVDSKGLDTSAPWPKYGHDVRNTNNPATTIEACP